MTNRIQVRRDTATNWTTANPVLKQGEPGFETDTGYVKWGDGTTAWTALPYSTDALAAQVAATYVAFKNCDGTPVTGKRVVITLTADGTDIDNIQVVTP